MVRVSLSARAWDAAALRALEPARAADPWGGVPSAFELFKGAVLLEACDDLGEVGLLAIKVMQFEAGRELQIVGAVRTRGGTPIWRDVFAAVDVLADQLDASVIGLQTMHAAMFGKLKAAGYQETGRTFIKDRRIRGRA